LGWPRFFIAGFGAFFTKIFFGTMFLDDTDLTNDPGIIAGLEDSGWVTLW
jgi:hypothetical protein